MYDNQNIKCCISQLQIYLENFDLLSLCWEAYSIYMLRMGKMVEVAKVLDKYLDKYNVDVIAL